MERSRRDAQATRGILGRDRDEREGKSGWHCIAVAAWVAGFVAVMLGVVFLARRSHLTWTVKRTARRCRITDYPFKSGDLVLTSSIGWGTGFAVKIATRSHINHTALVYVDPDTGQPFFWEINGNGTRLATIDDFVREADRHRVYVRALEGPPLRAEDVQEVIARQWERTFNFDVPLAWCRRSAMAGVVPARLAHGKPWRDAQRTCAHMTTEGYVMLGVVDGERMVERGHDIEATFAADWARARLRPDIIPLAPEYGFGPLVRLDLVDRRRGGRRKARLGKRGRMRDTACGPERCLGRGALRVGGPSSPESSATRREYRGTKSGRGRELVTRTDRRGNAGATDRSGA